MATTQRTAAEAYESSILECALLLDTIRDELAAPNGAESWGEVTEAAEIAKRLDCILKFIAGQDC